MNRNSRRSISKGPSKPKRSKPVRIVYAIVAPNVLCLELFDIYKTFQKLSLYSLLSRDPGSDPQLSPAFPQTPATSHAQQQQRGSTSSTSRQPDADDREDGWDTESNNDSDSNSGNEDEDYGEEHSEDHSEDHGEGYAHAMDYTFKMNATGIETGGRNVQAMDYKNEMDGFSEYPQMAKPSDEMLRPAPLSPPALPSLNSEKATVKCPTINSMSTLWESREQFESRSPSKRRSMQTKCSWVGGKPAHVGRGGALEEPSFRVYDKVVYQY